MKTITNEIAPFQESEFLFPIRSKHDYVLIVLNACKQFVNGFDTTQLDCQTKIKLVVDKMSRIFIFKSNKYFSVVFPFTVYLSEGNIDKITTKEGIEINSKNLSSAYSSMKNEYNYPFTPETTESLEPFETPGILLIQEILLSEPGYLRFDFDPDLENGHLHPLNHLDINYSNEGTYKLGLLSTPLEEVFEDILNLKTNCHYLVEQSK